MTNANIAEKWRLACGVLRHLGPGWVWFRLGYAWRRHTGALARGSPIQSWTAIPAASSLPSWLAAPSLPSGAAGWGNRCVAEATDIAQGKFVLFFHHHHQLGFPPDWHRNSFTGQGAPRGSHWSALGDFDFGDIKAIWEPSRFGWAFTLARANARTGDVKHAGVFWELFEDWCKNNPPNEGANWKCGQEATFRLMAATFAVAQYSASAATTAQRIELWSQFVIATGRRIAANLNYALSQSNNHGVSECVGLLTAGLLAVESPEARGWRESGLRHLKAQLDELVYADGGFSQHSIIYHRVLLHDLLWAITILRKAKQPVPDWLQTKARRALEFLAVLVDPSTGGAPLLGANDGSNILPLDECAYDDLRGVVQAGYTVLDGVRVLPDGRWDESVFWLTGRDPAAFPLRRIGLPERWHATDSGCFQWRSGDARLFFFCPTRFRHRPGPEMLHVDVWWRGKPVAHDAGTYSYNSSGPFSGALEKAAVHNLPMLAGIEPLKKAGRFLYLPWPRGTAQWHEQERRFSASHDAYGVEAKIERSIAAPQTGVFEITDVVAVNRPHRVRLHWLLADVEWKFADDGNSLSATMDDCQFTIVWKCDLAPCAINLVRAEKNSALGWWSRHYLAVEPAVSLELQFDVAVSMKISTSFGEQRG